MNNTYNRILFDLAVSLTQVKVYRLTLLLFILFIICLNSHFIVCVLTCRVWCKFLTFFFRLFSYSELCIFNELFDGLDWNDKTSFLGRNIKLILLSYQTADSSSLFWNAIPCGSSKCTTATSKISACSGYHN